MTGLPAVQEVLGAVLLEVLKLTGCSASKTGILGDQLLRLYQAVSGNPIRVDQRASTVLGNFSPKQGKYIKSVWAGFKSSFQN